jgi:hypothetical protein
MFKRLRLLCAALLLGGLAACGKNETAATASTSPAQHAHHPPHGGTPVVLGGEAYHLEFVRDAIVGKLSAYVLDGEMEEFVRLTAPSLELVVIISGARLTLTLHAVANPATGEKIGDTSLFEVEAEWLKGTDNFDVVLPGIDIRGTHFGPVAFNFPKGSDRD